MNYYYPPMLPVYYGQYDYRNQYAHAPYQMWPQNVQQTKGTHENKGNICAYVSDEPVHYQKLNINHWPSDDYKKPHPKGFLHTLHTKQYLGQYIPHR